MPSAIRSPLPANQVQSRVIIQRLRSKVCWSSVERQAGRVRALRTTIPKRALLHIRSQVCRRERATPRAWRVDGYKLNGVQARFEASARHDVVAACRRVKHMFLPLRAVKGTAAASLHTRSTACCLQSGGNLREHRVRGGGGAGERFEKKLEASTRGGGRERPRDFDPCACAAGSCCCSCALVLRPAKKPLKPPPTAELQAWYNSPDDTAEGDATRPVKIPSVRARASAHAHQARQCVSSCSDLHACHRGLAEYPHASSEHVPLLADAL